MTIRRRTSEPLVEADWKAILQLEFGPLDAPIIALLDQNGNTPLSVSEIVEISDRAKFNSSHCTNPNRVLVEGGVLCRLLQVEAGYSADPHFKMFKVK